MGKTTVSPLPKARRIAPTQADAAPVLYQLASLPDPRLTTIAREAWIDWSRWSDDSDDPAAESSSDSIKRWKAELEKLKASHEAHGRRALDVIERRLLSHKRGSIALMAAEIRALRGDRLAAQPL